jgi:hypothetical protein
VRGKEKYDDPADTVEKKRRGKDVFFRVSQSSVKRERIQGDSRKGNGMGVIGNQGRIVSKTTSLDGWYR